MKKVHIAVIDDGINYEEINFKLKHNLAVDDDMQVKENTEFYKSFHGTMCSKIILKYLKTEAHISSIKILDEKGISDINKLLVALRKAEEIGADIINLSLGSTTFKDKEKLLPAINSASYKGMIIVCAVNNLLYYTYPATFTNVISVCADRENKLKEEEIEISDTNFSNIFIKAFAKHTVKFNDKTTEQLYPANSYATPMVTAIIANNYNLWSAKGMLYVEDIKICLNNLSVNKKDAIFEYSYPDWIQNALYIHIGNKNIDTFDLRYLDKNLNIFKYEFEADNEFINFINDYIKTENSCIDTLIIKTKSELSNISAKKLQEIIKEKVHSLIYLDEHNFKHNLSAAKGGFKVWSIPDILKYNISNDRDFSLKEISVPLITIKSENISKFLSNDLKAFFENKGHNCQIFSDDCYKLLSNAVYIDSNMNEITVDKLIYSSNEIIDTKKIDLAIMEFENEDFFEIFSNISDIVITLKNNTLIVQYEKIKKNFPVIDGKIDINTLTQDLYSALE